jgi:alcohol dehydrogenase
MVMTKAAVMKAAQIHAYGGDEVVAVTPEASCPAVSEGKAVIEIHAAGVNPIDWKIRQGYFAKRAPLQLPLTLGGDFSGIVSEIGEGVPNLKIGDEVYGQAGIVRGGSGTFAEYALASMDNIAKKPQNIDHMEAAALPLVGVSAFQALIEHIGLKKGQKILIHGGGGGIGTAALQIAKHIGAVIYTTARSEDAAYVKGLGADSVIDYKTQRFEEIAHGLDAVFDTVGGETYTRSFAVLKKGGVIVSMLEQPNEELMEKFGVTAIYEFTQVTGDRLQKLAELVEKGAVTIHVDKTFPLDEAAEALHYLETGHPKGKVVLKVR